MRLKISILMIMFIFIGDIGINSTAYRSYIDYKDFYKVINENTGQSPIYDNNTLTISVGDRIIWVNNEDDRMNIISEERLWEDDKAFLPYLGREFSYTFNKSGIYNFYINRYPFPKQTIIVYDSAADLEDKNKNIDTDKDIDIINLTNSSENDINLTNSSKNDINLTNSSEKINENIILNNPLFMPLNIIKNFKIMAIIIFVIITIIPLIKT